MKKVLLFAIAIVAVSFASCTSKGNAEQPVNADTVVTVVEEAEVVVPDTTSAAVVDETAAVAEPAAAN